MDMEWSKLVELEHPWHQGVTLYTITSGAAHNILGVELILGVDLK